jgi:branched-chain amino acid transport system permease protein
MACLVWGLSLTWGLLRQINLSHFATGLSECLSELSDRHCVEDQPAARRCWCSCRCSSLWGQAMQWLLSRFAISPFNSLLVTFGITVMIESGIQGIWTADYRQAGVAVQRT